jgi:hypothetical protein
MKKAVFIALALFIAFSLGLAFAHEGEITPGSNDDFHHLYIGIVGGYAYNTLYTSTGYRTLTQYEAGHGFTLGLTARWAFFDWLSVQAELSYIQKNYSQIRTGLLSRTHYTITNSFVEFPIFANLNWRVYQQLSLFANLGAYLGVWANSHTKGTINEMTENVFAPQTYYYSYDEDVPFDTRRDNRFDAGLLAGLGVKYDFKPFCVYVEGRFNYGLTDLQKDYMKNKVPRINDTVTVQAGIQFNKSILNIFSNR